MKKFLIKHWPFLLLLTLALLTRFLFLAYPAEVVFDEVHFGKFVSAYFNHQYYFDIHPPLGKMMIAGFVKIFGYKGDFDFSKIGDPFSATNLFILRFLPAFFSSLFVILIYELILLLGFSKKSAFLGGFLVLFDNSFLVQSKFILIDIFLLFFGFASLYFLILAEKSPKKKFLPYIISAIFAGLAFSIKWTGLSFLGIILFFIFLSFLKQFKIKDFSKKILIFVIFPFLVYLLVFAVHFALLKNSGPGNAFMSPSFQKTLSENKISKDVKPLSFWGKFIELNTAMYKRNAEITASHPYASKWYEWPLTKKPIWYWVKNSDGKTADIYLLGNPLIWLTVFWSVLAILLMIFSGRFGKIRKKLSPLIYFLILGYFINLLPFIFIDRVTFLYHYLPSLAFGILILTLLYEKLLINLPFSLYLGFLIAVFLLFLFLSPLSYGFPIPLQFHQIYEELFL